MSSWVILINLVAVTTTNVAVVATSLVNLKRPMSVVSLRVVITTFPQILSRFNNMRTLGLSVPWVLKRRLALQPGIWHNDSNLGSHKICTYTTNATDCSRPSSKFLPQRNWKTIIMTRSANADHHNQNDHTNRGWRRQNGT